MGETVCIKSEGDGMYHSFKGCSDCDGTGVMP